MESARPCGGCLIRFASACGRIAPALPPLVGESLGRIVIAPALPPLLGESLGHIVLTVSAADQAQDRKSAPGVMHPSIQANPWGTGNREEVDMRWGVVLLGY